jgi:carbonic anhydrase
MAIAVRSNVRMQIEMLKHSEPVLKPLISSGRIKVVGACYDLDTGAVEFF